MRTINTANGVSATSSPALHSSCPCNVGAAVHYQYLPVSTIFEEHFSRRFRFSIGCRFPISFVAASPIRRFLCMHALNKFHPVDGRRCLVLELFFFQQFCILSFILVDSVIWIFVSFLADGVRYKIVLFSLCSDSPGSLATYLLHFGLPVVI